MFYKTIKILALTLASLTIFVACNKDLAPGSENKAGNQSLTTPEQAPKEQSEEIEGRLEEEGTYEEGSAEDIATDKAVMEKENISNDQEDSEKEAKESKNAPIAELSNYITYNEANLKMASSKGPVVLFFHASWCPSCQALDKELKAKGSEIPAGVTVLDVDYDNSAALKKQFNIVQQHTLVQIDKDGKEVTRWIGGDVDTFKEKIKQ